MSNKMNNRSSALDNMANMKALDTHGRGVTLLDTFGLVYKFTCREIQLCADSAKRENRLWSRQDINALPNSIQFGPKAKTFSSAWGNHQSVVMERKDGRSAKIEFLPVSSNTAREGLTREECLSFSGLKDKIINHLKSKDTCLQIFTSEVSFQSKSSSASTQVMMETAESIGHSTLSKSSTGVQVAPSRKDKGCQTSPMNKKPTLLDVAVQTEGVAQFEASAGDVAMATKDTISHFKYNPAIANNAYDCGEIPLFQTHSHVSIDSNVLSEIAYDHYDISDDEDLPPGFFKSAGGQDHHQERNTVSLAEELSLAMAS